MKYQNVQFWSECQLVSTWNAGRYYGKKVPEPGIWEYALIVIESGGIYGSCTSIKKELRRLRLKFVEGRKSLSWIKKNLPVELGLFTKHRGYHSVLCINVQNNKLLLLNYARRKSLWLSWKKVKKMLDSSLYSMNLGKLRNY